MSLTVPSVYALIEETGRSGGIDVFLVGLHNVSIAVGEDSILAPLPAYATFLYTPEESLRRRLCLAVHKHRPGLDSLCDPLGASNVLAIHAGAETGVCVVGTCNDILFIRPWLARDNGTCSTCQRCEKRQKQNNPKLSALPNCSSAQIIELLGGLSIRVGWMKKPLLFATSGSPCTNL